MSDKKTKYKSGLETEIATRLESTEGHVEQNANALAGVSSRLHRSCRGGPPHVCPGNLRKLTTKKTTPRLLLSGLAYWFFRWSLISFFIK